MWVGLGLAVAVGISLGLLGGGGSILTVPILTYVVGMDPREAIAASLFIVGVTSAVGLLPHARASRVRWKVGALFGLASMAGAFVGGLAGGHINGTILMFLFAVMMVATATAMIRGRKKDPSAGSPAGAHAGPDATAHDPAGAGLRGGHATQVALQAPVETDSSAPDKLPLVRIILDGLAVGIATGLVGAGGGFLVVPVLNLLGGLPMAMAVGTSLLVVAMKSFAGLGGYLLSVQFNWPLVGAFTAIAVAGSFIGSALAGRIPEKSLRKGFGYFVLAMGAIVLIQEVPDLIALATGAG